MFKKIERLRSVTEKWESIKIDQTERKTYVLFFVDDTCMCIENSKEPWPVWLNWLEHHLVYQKVAGSIHSQGTYLGYSAIHGRDTDGGQPINTISYQHLSLSLFFPPSLPPSFPPLLSRNPQVRIKKNTKEFLNRLLKLNKFSLAGMA